MEIEESKINEVVACKKSVSELFTIMYAVSTSPMLKGCKFRGESRVTGTCGGFTTDSQGKIDAGVCH